MLDSYYRLIRKIAKRNGAIAYYPITTFQDETSGQRIMTCDNFLFPETDAIGLFQGVSDEEAQVLLRAFLTHRYAFTFEIARHFARLLAVRGRLVEEELRVLLDQTDWTSYASPFVILAGLAALPEGGTWMLRLLDVVPNDTRDGLLTACWYCDSEAVQEKVLLKFEMWSTDPTWGSGDGEGAWLKQFLSKWIKTSQFSYQRLERLVTTYLCCF